MAALSCDICGGKLVVGSGGTAVCDVCGTEHSPERMKEKIQELRNNGSASQESENSLVSQQAENKPAPRQTSEAPQTVRIDNTHMIANYLGLSANAYSDGNYAESESYANKVIEMVPSEYRAWLYKGMSAGWRSGLGGTRLAECASSLAKAVRFSPDSDREQTALTSKECLIKLSVAVMSLRADRFIKWPDKEETVGFSKDIMTVLDALTAFISQAGAVFKLSEFTFPMARTIFKAVSIAWDKKIKPDYEGDADDLPNQYDFKKYISRIDCCISLLEQAITLSEDPEENMKCYKALITLENSAIKGCAYNSRYFSFSSDREIRNDTIRSFRRDGYIPDPARSCVWYKEYTLTDDAAQKRRNKISAHENKVKELETVVARKRYNEYWEVHAEKKEQLEQEREQLTTQIEQHRSEIKAIPGNEEIAKLRKQRDELEMDRKALGLFKLAERKELKLKIAALNLEISVIEQRMQVQKAEIEAKISLLDKRIQAINEELTKPR